MSEDREQPTADRPQRPARTAENVISYEEFLLAQKRRAQATGGVEPAGALAEGEGRSEEVAAIVEEIALLPEIRNERIESARRRIREGFYDRPEVLEEIARRLLHPDAPEEDESPRRGDA